MLAKALQSASNTGVQYVDDVFSTYLYTGNGSTQTITNGIDLAGKGGLVWVKQRDAAISHFLFDTQRGATKRLSSDLTDAETTSATSLTAFTSSGFSIGSGLNLVNNNNATYASWTFRKTPKFFDVVTYTGDGGASRTLSHALGVEPGMMIVKCSGSTSDWFVYHRSLGATKNLRLNTTAAEATNATIPWNGTAPTSTQFTVENVLNSNGVTYVAYLFAHDTATDGLIQCGSVSLDANQSADVNLGWEPQFVLVKLSSTTSDWRIVDAMRGMPVTQSDSARLFANLSSAESTGLAAAYPGSLSTITNAQGFRINFGGAGAQTAIYVAIRRPNKPPTSGTQVFFPQTGNAIGTANLTGVNFAPDAVISRSTQGGVNSHAFTDKLRGTGSIVLSASTAAEVTGLTGITGWLNDGVALGTDGSQFYINSATYNPYSRLFFRRAPGFFDEVCYTGDGVSGRTINHALGVVPELMIVKRRNGTANWTVYAGDATKFLILETTAGLVSSSAYWNNTAPTASAFTVGSDTNVNNGASTYVAYLFASLPGISKVGSYTGNGSNQTINCGFSAGARFVLIKRTDNTGDWYVWDTARGIVAGNDPHLSLNSTAAEVTTNDSIDPDNSGFVVNQLAATNINVNSASYIYFAIA